MDFVLRRCGALASIEVKSGRKRERTPGAAEFIRRFKPRKSLLVGEGGIPLEQFLSRPARHWVD